MDSVWGYDDQLCSVSYRLQCAPGYKYRVVPLVLDGLMCRGEIIVDKLEASLHSSPHMSR